MTEFIDWVETQAQENIKFRLSCFDALIKECNITLTILLAGVGATATYVFKLLSSTSFEKWLVFGIAALCLYFLLLCGIVLFKCLSIGEVQVPTNEPDNLYQPKFTLLQIRELELKNTQTRINKAVSRNSMIADWLNIVRTMILASPLIFISAMVLGSYF